MNDGYMPAAGQRDKVAEAVERRALGEAQTDLEMDLLGKHPDNVDRDAKVEREATERLASLIARAERLIEEKKALQTDISEIFKEAKSSGHHVPAMKAVIKRRAMDPAEADELDHMIDLYRTKLGG